MRNTFTLGVAGAVAIVIALGAALIVHAESKTNKVALASSAKPVSYVEARASTFHPSRTYVGTIRPWVEANVGPQFVTAYVGTVLVRPGALVKRNEVLGTLDCRNASAATQAIASRATAIEARQKAIADEAARKKSLLERGFIAEADVVQALAQSEAEAANLAAQRASLAQSSLQVDDCILRAPFDAEVSARYMDPGAFARPGLPVVSVVDRTTVRITVDVPEDDFGWVGPGTQTKIHIISTNRDIVAAVSRRAPSADPGTRTIHVEIDVPDATRSLPVNTTADVRIDVGLPALGTEIPVHAATVDNGRAVFFVEEGGVAHLHAEPMLGELGAGLFFPPSALAPGAHVITEGREVLKDNDRVSAKASPLP